MESSIVLWAGHFIVGTAYYLRKYLLLTKVEKQNKIDQMVSEDLPIEEIEKIVDNKLLVFVGYLLVGYINIVLSFWRVCKKLAKRKWKFNFIWEWRWFYGTYTRNVGNGYWSQ